MFYAFVVHFPRFRDDAGPGDRKPIGADAQLLHQADVLCVAMVLVAGHRARGMVNDIAWLFAIGVPY